MKYFETRRPRWLLLAALLILSNPSCEGESFGTRGVPQIDVSRDTIQFEATMVGMSVQQVITISSYGKQPLIIEVLELDPEIQEFEILTALEIPMTLEHGMEQDITISYTPQELGQNPDTNLVIECNDHKAGDHGRLVVPISVREHTPQLERSEGYFGWGADDPREINRGCEELINRKEVVLTNSGSGRLLIEAYELKGRDLPEGETARDHFSVCPSNSWSSRTIGQGGGSLPQQVWALVFHPRTAGEKRATLTISSNGGSVEIELRGGGEGRSSIEVHPPVLSWPELNQGEQGVKSLDIINTGTLSVVVESIRVQPAVKRQFYLLSGATFVPDEDSASGRLSSPIPKNGNARLEVTYRAQQPEPVQAELEIYHSAQSPPSPIIVRLMGNEGAPQMLVDPMQVEFTGTPVGTDLERSLVVTNGGNAQLDVEKIEIGQDGETLGHENFNCHPEPCSASLAPGEFKSFKIVYHRPLDAVQIEDRGCANVFSNDLDQQPSICVSLLARNPGGNLPPSACIEADPGTTVDVGTTVTLSCACSSDPDEGQEIERCTWMLVDWPPNSSAELSLQTGDPDTPAELTVDAPGVYRVVLVVTDDSDTHFLSPEEDIELVAQ